MPTNHIMNEHCCEELLAKLEYMLENPKTTGIFITAVTDEEFVHLCDGMTTEQVQEIGENLLGMFVTE